MVVGDHAEHGVRSRLLVKRLGKGVGEIHDVVLLGDRPDRGGAVVDIRPDDIVNAFVRHLLHALDSELGILLVVEGDDVDVVGLVADLHAAGAVPHVGQRLHGANVGRSPSGRGPAGNADEADLQLRVIGECRAGESGHQHDCRCHAKSFECRTLRSHFFLQKSARGAICSTLPVTTTAKYGGSIVVNNLAGGLRTKYSSSKPSLSRGPISDPAADGELGRQNEQAGVQAWPAEWRGVRDRFSRLVVRHWTMRSSSAFSMR